MNFTDTMASYSGSVMETLLNRISQLESKVIELQHKVCQSLCKCSCNSTKSTNYANRTVSRAITEKNISGTVKWFHVKKGFGFITRNDTHKDVFVHRGSISRPNPNHKTISVGEKELVVFDVMNVSGRTPEAVDVRGPDDKHVVGSKRSRSNSKSATLQVHTVSVKPPPKTIKPTSTELEVNSNSSSVPSSTPSTSPVNNLPKTITTQPGFFQPCALDPTFDEHVSRRISLMDTGLCLNFHHSSGHNGKRKMSNILLFKEK